MTVIIDGTTGIDTILDGAVSTAAKLANGVVTPAKTQVGALPSMVRLNTLTGWGATNTAIARFTTTVTNQGTDITYADSATLGASFTINTAGVYAMSFSFAVAGGTGHFGFSLNSTQLTTAITSITAADALKYSTLTAINTAGNVADCLYLPAGSVIRPHTNTGLSVGTPASQFTITRVA